MAFYSLHSRNRNNLKSVALSSYRMQIGISSSTLAENLVTSYMRDVLTVMPQRDMIKTCQPEDPALVALASTKIMLDFRERHRMLEDFLEQVFGELVNIGQVGEIIAVLSYLLPMSFYQ
ncbi:hypothetical protein V1514DRAFT_164869 [Lipomyces japonicus]|uniref:uncharacterized protein n=1 Tax=Lipomyces japonicus TaxID=56871 RepID=UPI0034CD54AD